CVGADTDAVNQTAGGVVAREVGEGGVWFVKRIRCKFKIDPAVTISVTNFSWTKYNGRILIVE
ncbi:MAG: hypothetical protein ACI9XB_002324, partial [Gammaproteobacteria bacterium]